MTSILVGPQGLIWAIERVGVPKLLFGSNFYSMVRVGRIDALDAIEGACLNDADRLAILGGNTRSLLGV